MWAYCRSGGTHSSLGPGRLVKMPNVTVHCHRELYCERPGQDTLLQEKLNHSWNPIAIVLTGTNA